MMDSERLNWMAAHGADFCYVERMEGRVGVGITSESQQVGVRVPDKRDGHEYMWLIYDAPTIREAIDAMMAANGDRAPHVPLSHPCFAEATP